MNAEYKNIIPIIIGCDRRLASALYRKYKTKVHIFGDSCDLLVRLLPYTRFHLIWEMTSETLSMYINGFADDYPEHIAVVFASDEYTDMLSSSRESIESSCIIWREGIEF